MTQPSLFPPTRSGSPATSYAAAASVTRISAAQNMLLVILRGLGPMTDEQLHSAMLGNAFTISPSGCRTRRKELVDAGLVVASPRLGRTKGGRVCTIWQSVPTNKQES
jgi:hypothetical protein